MSEKSPWQTQFEALPSWAQQFVLLVQARALYGLRAASPSDLCGLSDKGKFELAVLMYERPKSGDEGPDWYAVVSGAAELADALTAPWPPPPPPKRELRAFNVVELAADGEDEMEGGCAFDQPCAFGHRVEGHAVYCHNEAWPNSPRKCHRTWYTGGKIRDEDCPGYVPSPDFSASAEAE